MIPDITIRVRFLTPTEGGRSTPVEGSFYACPLFVDGDGFDCRILLNGNRLELGRVYNLEVKFLYQELALPKLHVGKEVFLWEGKKVAEGNVIQMKQ